MILSKDKAEWSHLSSTWFRNECVRNPTDWFRSAREHYFVIGSVLGETLPLNDLESLIPPKGLSRKKMLAYYCLIFVLVVAIVTIILILVIVFIIIIFITIIIIIIIIMKRILKGFARTQC